MDQIIKDFMKDRLFDAHDIAGYCYTVSESFIDHCKQQNLETMIVFLMDYKGKPFPNVHSLYNDSEFLVHHVTLADNKTYDFTHRQFDLSAPVPLIQTLSELQDLWDTVIVDTPFVIKHEGNRLYYKKFFKDK